MQNRNHRSQLYLSCRLLVSHVVQALPVGICLPLLPLHLAPGVLNHLRDIETLRNIAIKHATNQIDALVAHGEWNAQVAVHDLVDAVKRVLLVDDCIEKDAKCPDILLLSAIRLTSQNLRCRII